MVICKKCNIEKTLDQFFKDQTKKLGHRSICKSCDSLRVKEAYHLNKDKRKVSHRLYYLKNKEAINKANKLYYETHKEQIRTWQKQYEEDNKEKTIKYKHDYHLRNREKLCKKTRDWVINNKEYKLQQDKLRYINNKELHCFKTNEYKKENPDKVNAWNAKRRAQKINATPKWLTRDDFRFIRKFYKESHRLYTETGIKYNVDHIVPLLGDNVCGLHVPWNLQVITQKENFEKHNKLIY